jgi:hypothetical protein
LSWTYRSRQKPDPRDPSKEDDPHKTDKDCESIQSLDGEVFLEELPFMDTIGSDGVDVEELQSLYIQKLILPNKIAFGDMGPLLRERLERCSPWYTGL